MTFTKYPEGLVIQIDSGSFYPHCSPDTLHKRGECIHCDKFPHLQFWRSMNNVSFDLFEPPTLAKITTFSVSPAVEITTNPCATVSTFTSNKFSQQAVNLEKAIEKLLFKSG